MEISKKLLITLLIIAVVITAIAMAAAFIPQVRAAFSNVGGPIGSGLMNVLSYPLKAALSGGGPTLFAFYGIATALVLGFAYWVWHWDIGYKINGQANNAGANYQSAPTQNIIPLADLQSEPTGSATPKE